MMYDIIIVGYGPVGAGAAILMSRAGLRVAIVERTTDVLELPRAVLLDSEVIRAFQGVGLGDEINAVTQTPRNPDAVYFTNSKREKLFGMELPDIGNNGWREFGFMDQPEVEHTLREIISNDGQVDLYLGCEATALTENGDHVLLKARNLERGEEIELQSKYLLGSDGAASFVRGQIDSEWESLGYDQDWLVVDIVLKPEGNLPLVSMQVCDPARITTYICSKDPYRRWEFKLLPGEDRAEMEKPERIQALLDAWLPREHYTLRRAAVYQFHAATAAKWQTKRVFLAGDAAHQTPPFLGQGLNTGFRDVVNLSWKLPLVMNGISDASMLKSYSSERDPHAKDLVDWAVAVGRLMETLADAEAGRVQEGPSEEQKESGYGQGRTAPPLRHGVLVETQVANDGYTGFLFSQPMVREADGNETLLDEVLGHGFAVVARTSADLSMSDQSREFLNHIGARCISLDELEPVRGTFDSLFAEHRAAIVRPDRYVFGVVDEAHDIDALISSLKTKLSTTSE